jgi:glycerophosphoryl diester phosphodiesterase
MELLVALTANGAELAPSWHQHKTVAHALGGIQGFTYTNSREALELNYRQGHCVFEIDLQTSRDGIMVVRDDWVQALAEWLEQVHGPARPSILLRLPIAARLRQVFSVVTAEDRRVDASTWRYLGVYS